MYELDAFKVTHATKYPGPILSLGISPNAALLAVGLADGQLLVRKHSHNKGAAPGLPGVPSCGLVGCRTWQLLATMSAIVSASEGVIDDSEEWSLRLRECMCR